MIANVNNNFFKIDKSLNYIQWVVVAGVFMERYFELLMMFIATLLIYRQIKTVKINTNLLVALVSLFFISLSLIMLNGYAYGKFFQQYFLLIIYLLLYYYIFKFVKFDIEGLFCKHLTLSYWVALIGLFQFIVFLVFNIDICSFIYTIKNPPIVAPHIIRVYSILDEPGYLSTSLMPAVAYCILSPAYGLRVPYRKCIIIISASLLTFGAAGYFIIMILLLYRIIVLNKYKYLILSMTIILLLFISSLGVYKFGELNKNEDFFLADIYIKIDDTISAFSLMDPTSFENTNLSTYATMTNVWVAINAPSRILGTGLGTHVLNYEGLYQSNFQYYGLNKDDGYALFNRIFSEFGIIGIFLLLLFLYKNFNKKSIINVSVFFILLMLCIRGGNYIRYGIIFYFYLFFYTKLNKWNT